MKGSVKVVKGRIEEAVGALTDNDKLRSKGKLDQNVGRVIQDGEKNIRQAKKYARAIIGRAENNAQEALDKVKGQAAS
ncbi:MAG: hypothetical protein A2X48_07160 [Lentisphaerae bacterium GWF2_49_21]|nr:MAG: hypothetical protein A2X48_07160 [Lentisphaerae bacterium GWF2_49_21]